MDLELEDGLEVSQAPKVSHNATGQEKNAIEPVMPYNKIPGIGNELMKVEKRVLHNFSNEEENHEDGDHGRKKVKSHDPGGLGEVNDKDNVIEQSCCGTIVTPLFGTSRMLLPHCPLAESDYHEPKERDLIAVRATFPEFFPRGPVQDSYDCLLLQPNLEDLCSGRGDNQEN